MTAGSSATPGTSGLPPGWLLYPPPQLPVFNTLIGPLYVRRDGEGVGFGFRVELKHCNPLEVCHGGMLVAFADIALTAGGNYLAEMAKFFTTVSLTSDFMGPAAVGAWVETKPELLKLTRNLAFEQCLVAADGVPVLRASGTFRHGGEPDPRFDRLRRLLQAAAAS